MPKESKKEKVESAEAKVAETKPQKPDEEYFAAKEKELTDQVNALKKLKEEQQKAIGGKRDEKTAFEETKEQKHAKWKETKELWDGLVQKKRSLEQMEKQSKENIKTAEKDFKENNEEEIENRIKQIEYVMSTGTMSLKEEKNYMLQIRDLKRKRPAAAAAARALEAQKAKTAADASLDPSLGTKEQLVELKVKIDEMKQEVDQQFGDWRAFADSGKSTKEEIAKLVEAKKKYSDQIEELINKRNEVKEEKRSQQKAFNEWEKKQREEKRKAYEAKRALEQKQWEAENAQRELEKPNKHLDEWTNIQQIIIYCQTLIGADKKEEKVEAAAVEFDKPEGAVLLLSKKERDTDMFFAGNKKKNLKKKGGSDKAKSTAIKHTADTMKMFSDVKISPPLSTADIPPILEELEQKLAVCKEKMDLWENERKEKVKAAASAQEEAE